MKLLPSLFALGFANFSIEDEAISKAIALLSNSQTAWNTKLNHVMDNIKHAGQTNASPKRSIPWFFGGGYHHTPQAPDVHSIHPDETKKSIFGFSWGKSDLKDRHDPSKQLTDHRIPGSFVRGMHANLLSNFKPEQLAASFAGDVSHAIFGRKTNSWLDLLNIGGGKLDEVLTKADEAKRKIEALIATAGLSDATKQKLLGAFNNYNDVILQDLLFTGFLAREYIPEKGGLAEATNLSMGTMHKFKNFLNNIVANKEIPIEQAIHSIEHRIGGLQVVEDLFNKLPDTKEKKEISKAIEALRHDLTGSLATFTKELAAVAAHSAKEAKAAAAEWRPRRLQAVESVNPEKEFQGVFSNLVSTALQAKDTLSGASASGLSLGGLQDFGNKLIKSTVHDSLLNQIQGLTGIPSKTLKTLFEGATGNSTQAVDQVKNLMTTMLDGVDKNTADSSQDVKTQMSKIGDLLKEKMGGSQALFDLLKKQLGPDTANAILGDSNKTLLSVIETLKEMDLPPVLQTTEEEVESTDTSSSSTDFEEVQVNVQIGEKVLAGQSAVLIKPEILTTEFDSTEAETTIAEDLSSSEQSFIDAIKTEYDEAMKTTVDSAEAASNFIDNVGNQIVDAGHEMAVDAENGFNALKDALTGKVLLGVEVTATEDFASTESDSTDSTLISEERASANAQELAEMKSTIHAEVDQAVTNLGEFAKGASDVVGNAVGSVAQGVGESIASLFVGENKVLLSVDGQSKTVLEDVATAAETVQTLLDDVTTVFEIATTSAESTEEVSTSPEQVLTSVPVLPLSPVTLGN